LANFKLPRVRWNGLACGALGIMLASCPLARARDSSPTLARVRAAGLLRCGIDIEEAEYSTTDENGNRASFDADLCRAVAIAVLGADARVAASRYPDDAAAIAALNAGEVDMVPTLPDDFMHATTMHLAFTRPVLWDGVGFLLLSSSPVRRARQLSGKKICFLAETQVEDSTRAWFAREHLDFVPFPFQEEGEMQAAFSTGNCGALAGDRTRLAETRATMKLHDKSTRLVPQSISRDPLAAAVRDDDRQWFLIVNWVIEGLLEAEQSGITQRNVLDLQSRQAEQSDPERRFLLGASHQVGSALGLGDDWVVRVIQATGNYGEIYQRTLGSGSPMKLPRGDNRLNRDGGAMLALPPK
jgi:general L-amino acid transport system substrate-binding protein